MLTADELAVVRSYVGSEPADVDLEDIHDRVLTVKAVVEEILRRRLADLLAAPASFTVPGGYSQSTAENIRSLSESLARVGTELGEDGVGPATARIIPPPARSAR